MQWNSTICGHLERNTCSYVIWKSGLHADKLHVLHLGITIFKSYTDWKITLKYMVSHFNIMQLPVNCNLMLLCKSFCWLWIKIELMKGVRIQGCGISNDFIMHYFPFTTFPYMAYSSSKIVTSQVWFFMSGILNKKNV